MFDSANGSVKVVQVLVGIFRATAGIRYKLLDDVRSVKDIVVNFRCRPPLNPDAIVVVLVAVGTERLQLASLFPGSSGSLIVNRITVCIVGNCLAVIRGQQILPATAICIIAAIGIRNAVFALDVSVFIVGYGKPFDCLWSRSAAAPARHRCILLRHPHCRLPIIIIFYTFWVRMSI